jgi:hypothetical protein
MEEVLSTLLLVSLTGGLTWAMFFIPSLFGRKISLPAKVVMLIPVIALSIFASTKIIEYLKFVVGW